MADVDFVSENARRMSRQRLAKAIHHKTRVYAAPGEAAPDQPAPRSLPDRICLISNDQLLGWQFAGAGSGTRNSLVHPVR